MAQSSPVLQFPGKVIVKSKQRLKAPPTLTLSPAADEACLPDINHLTLEPPVAVVRHGDPLEVNCSTLFNTHLGMHWVSTEGNTSLEKNSQFVTWNMTVVDWGTQARCNIKLNGSLLCGQDLTLTVYSKCVPLNMSIFIRKTSPFSEYEIMLLFFLYNSEVHYTINTYK